MMRLFVSRLFACLSKAQWIMDRKNNGHTVLWWLDVLGRWSISAVFLFAAVPKLFDIHGFAAVINAYAVLPDILILPTAVLLPVIEIVLAVGLLFNRRTVQDRYCGGTGLFYCSVILFYPTGARYRLWLFWARGA